MTTILIIIHLVVTLVMIGLILLQRSEGGGLGVGGGGGGMGSFAGPRATANILTKMTMYCFILFVGISLVLAYMAGHRATGGLINQLDANVPAKSAPATEPTAGIPAVATPAVDASAVSPDAKSEIKPEIKGEPPVSSEKAGVPIAK
jgi:preprotein translocase subunit SecG